MNKRESGRKERIDYIIKMIKANPELPKSDLLLKIMAAFMIGMRYAKEYLAVALYEVKNA